MKREITVNEVEQCGILSVIDVATLYQIINGNVQATIKQVSDLVNIATNIRNLIERIERLENIRTNPSLKVSDLDITKQLCEKKSTQLISKLIEINKSENILKGFVNVKNADLVTLLSTEIAYLKLDMYEAFSKLKKAI